MRLKNNPCSLGNFIVYLLKFLNLSSFKIDSGILDVLHNNPSFMHKIIFRVNGMNEVEHPLQSTLIIPKSFPLVLALLEIFLFFSRLKQGSE
jgi:hypothetical protein